MLQPRTRGFITCLSELRGSLDAGNYNELRVLLLFALALMRSFIFTSTHEVVFVCAVYDLTIGYKKQCPLFINNVYGTDPSEVHIHVRRIPIAEIPESEEDMSKWLYDIFFQKDQMLSSFSMTGSFPNSGIEEAPLDIPSGIFNLILHIVFSLCIFWWLYRSKWMRLYVAVVCVVLSLGTYYDWRPTPFYSKGKIL